MKGLEALESVQYVTVKGRRVAVINSPEWEALIEWLETLEDLTITKESLKELKSSGGNRKKAGWLKWEDIKEEIM